jgi:hypothetical protein
VYAASLALLAAWGVLRAGERAGRLCASYFEVPKKDRKARAIIDARPQNAQCKAPPKVELANVMELLRLVGELGGCWVLTADYRHWFYQIPLHWENGAFFTVAAAGAFYAMNVLAMGFSWAPYCAQVVAWAILLFTEPDEDALGVPAGVLRRPNPPCGIVRLGGVPGKRGGHTPNICGAIGIYYDNVFIAARSRILIDRWRKRAVRNARLFGAVWKDAPSVPSRSAIILGVELDAGSPTRWRHDPARIVKWAKLGTGPVDTPRKVARIIGIWSPTTSSASGRCSASRLKWMCSESCTE